MPTFPEDIRKVPTKLLSEDQREHYFKHGYIVLKEFLSPEWIDKLKVATAAIVETSRGYTKDMTLPLGQGDPAKDKFQDKLMLAAGHTRDQPMLTRLSAPVDVDDTYWQYSLQVAAPIAEDLLGGNVRFHHSKLNFKWPGSMEKIHWHQDIQFWPHTNYTPLTIGVYLEDVTEDMGPMHIVPLSVHDQLHPLVDPKTDKFTGILNQESLSEIDLSQSVSTCGPAGTVTVHNARCVHSSLPNLSSKARPLLLNTFSSTSAGLILAGTNAIHARSPRGTPVVRGVQEKLTVFDPRPCPMAPDFSAGYVSPFIKPDSEGNGTLICMDG